MIEWMLYNGSLPIRLEKLHCAPRHKESVISAGWRATGVTWCFAEAVAPMNFRTATRKTSGCIMMYRRVVRREDLCTWMFFIFFLFFAAGPPGADMPCLL